MVPVRAACSHDIGNPAVADLPVVIGEAAATNSGCGRLANDVRRMGFSVPSDAAGAAVMGVVHNWVGGRDGECPFSVRSPACPGGAVDAHVPCSLRL